MRQDKGLAPKTAMAFSTSPRLTHPDTKHNFSTWPHPEIHTACNVAAGWNKKLKETEYKTDALQVCKWTRSSRSCSEHQLMKKWSNMKNDQMFGEFQKQHRKRPSRCPSRFWSGTFDYIDMFSDPNTDGRLISGNILSDRRQFVARQLVNNFLDRPTINKWRGNRSTQKTSSWAMDLSMVGQLSNRKWPGHGLHLSRRTNSTNEKWTLTSNVASNDSTQFWRGSKREVRISWSSDGHS